MDVTENEIAEAVLIILSGTVSGEAKLSFLRTRIPEHVQLSAHDQEQSFKRPNEQMWEQRLRNIKSHSINEGNYIAEGYLTAPSRGSLRITDRGRKKVSGI
ncbi:winged helix-turn-helix domain-containing protein [Devosia crocina]|uniref:winged helix-turn-helix domain-containing protein n=1 Tax=Devosia crocina TaxID=429728 RepID=UPI001AECA383|nr:winged helix-turn-helix domain-containing protein [Devosia crocina]